MQAGRRFFRKILCFRNAPLIQGYAHFGVRSSRGAFIQGAFSTPFSEGSPPLRSVDYCKQYSYLASLERLLPAAIVESL